MWDGNSIKLDCDGHCTTINIIKISNFFKKDTIQEKITTVKMKWNVKGMKFNFKAWGPFQISKSVTLVFIFYLITFAKK